MKEYQDLIGKALIAVAIIIAGTIESAGGNIVSQIASALNTITGRIN